jgi:hypothetical protein
MASPPGSAHTPQTLLEWRMQQNQPEGTFPRQMWTPLEPFFLSHGYTLWIQLGPVDGDAMTLRSPDNTPRAPDPFVYSTPYQKGPPAYDMTLFFSKVGHNLLSLNCAIKA